MLFSAFGWVGFFFVLYQNSFVSRENSIFFNSMSSLSFTVFTKCSVGVSVSSPCTVSILCLSLLSSLSCLDFILLISYAWVRIWFSSVATVPSKLMSSSFCCWNFCLIVFISALSTTRSGLTVARTMNGGFGLKLEKSFDPDFINHIQNLNI